VVQMAINGNVTVWVAEVKTITIPRIGNGDAGHIAISSSKYRLILLLIGLQIDAGMEMIGSAFRETACQSNRDIQWIAEITLGIVQSRLLCLWPGRQATKHKK